MGVNDRNKEAQETRKAAAQARRMGKATYDGWKAFVNLEMSAAMKESYRAWGVEDMDIWSWLESRLIGLYKLSISFDSAHDSFVSSLTCRNPADKNTGLSLTARGGDWFKSLRVLAWKDGVYLKNDWTAEVQEGLKDKDDIG